jgi:hypothetical protein
VGDGEAGSEDGVALDAYSHVLPGMQQKAGLPQSTRFHDLTARCVKVEPRGYFRT